MEILFYKKSQILPLSRSLQRDMKANSLKKTSGDLHFNELLHGFRLLNTIYSNAKGEYDYFLFLVAAKADEP